MTTVASTQLGHGRVVITGAGHDPEDVVRAIDARAAVLGNLVALKFVNARTESGLFTERAVYAALEDVEVEGP